MLSAFIRGKKYIEIVEKKSWLLCNLFESLTLWTWNLGGAGVVNYLLVLGQIFTHKIPHIPAKIKFERIWRGVIQDSIKQKTNKKIFKSTPFITQLRWKIKHNFRKSRDVANVSFFPHNLIETISMEMS
jgi:hypothetical protein